MFLSLRHKQKRLYILSKKVVIRCYELAASLPAEEKTAIAEGIKKAALIGHANITKVLYQKKKKKKQKRCSIAAEAYVLIDAGLEMMQELNWVTTSQIHPLTKDVQTVFYTLFKMKKKYKS